MRLRAISNIPRPFVDSVRVFFIAAILIYPLFKLEYLDNWPSIESTFIADARMLREHLPHPSWQPLWYCGTRFDYIYPPALRYGTALTSLIFGVSTARAYHLYIAVLYALGIVGVYLLAYAASRSRAQGWLAAMMTALLSPSLLLMRALHNDSPNWVPQRLHVLMSYGEGPHISSLALIGLALATSFVALKQWRPGYLALAGVLCAAVVANNFYGATSLAMLFPILTWAVWLEVRRLDVLARAAGIAAIAYGLCAFWLTPSYIWITNVNLKWVAVAASRHSRLIAVLCVVLFAVVSFLFSRKRKQVAWPVFLWGSAFFVSIYVLGVYYFNFTIAGNGMRLAPELDLVLILLASYIVWSAWKRPMLRSGIVVLFCIALLPAVRYVAHAWTIFPQAGPLAERCEYDIPKWMNDHLAGARALPSGSIRFWYDAWHDNSEAYGGSDQGMLNQIIIGANWSITQDNDPAVATAWLQALGADAVIVPSKNSQENYHDYPNPEKFQGYLTALYDDHRGNIVYRVPRRFPAIARVVDRGALLSLGPLHAGGSMDRLSQYLSFVEHGPDSPVTLTRPSLDEIDANVNAEAGQALLIQETFDPGWQANSDGVSLPVERDPMGFMLVRAPAGAHTIRVHFDMPLENRIGWVLTWITCVVVAGLCWLARRRRAATAEGTP